MGEKSAVEIIEPLNIDTMTTPIKGQKLTVLEDLGKMDTVFGGDEMVISDMDDQGLEGVVVEGGESGVFDLVGGDGTELRDIALRMDRDRLEVGEQSLHLKLSHRLAL